MYRFAMIATVLSGSMVEACRAADGDETFKLSPEFYVWPNQMTLFRQRLIHEELRITKDDRVKVGQAERKILILRNKTETEMRKLQGDKLIAAYDSLLINLARQTDRELKAALKPAQYRRFNEIVLQMRGVRAFFDPDFQKALHLTKSQQRQLGEIQDEATVAARKLMYERRQKAGVKDESRKRRQDIDDRAAKRILRLLTSEQRKTYKSMLGKLLAPKPRTPSIVLTSTPHFGERPPNRILTGGVDSSAAGVGRVPRAGGSGDVGAGGVLAGRGRAAGAQRSVGAGVLPAGGGVDGVVLQLAATVE